MRQNIKFRSVFSNLEFNEWSPQLRNETKHLADWVIVIRPVLGDMKSVSLRFSICDILEDESSIRFEDDILFSFLDRRSNEIDDSREELQDLLSKSDTGILDVNNVGQFFTMLTSMKVYRFIVELLGPQGATQALRSINDLIATKNQRQSTWYRKAISSVSFKMNFLYQSESFFVYHNAEAILLGLQNERLDAISNQLTLKFRLETFENDHRIRFNYNTKGPLQSRISVIIGKNGVGKSQSLFHFANSLISDSSALRDDLGQRPQISRLIAVTSPGETTKTFPRRTRNTRLNYQKIHLGGRDRDGGGFGELLVRLARDSNQIKSNSKWEIFINSISSIDNYQEIHVSYDPRLSGQPGNISLINMMSGTHNDKIIKWGYIDRNSDIYIIKEGKKIPLSSGHITFIRFALNACLHVENGTFILIDEPETHLHPNLITDFISLLNNILELTGSLALIATHSAYFVREAPRSQVIVLQRSEDGLAKAITPRLRTLGADIGRISHFVFGDPLFGKLRERFKRAAEDLKISPAELLRIMDDEVAAEAWMSLKAETEQSKS
jgi:energy-coupling factor transporter ATP-binding protein EcfA2